MKVKFKWTDVEDNISIAMKKIVGHDVLLSYPKSREEFVIHTYASKMQIGGE